MTPLFQQIVNELVAALREGRIVSGERLPSEHELARRFSVSRITAKKALDELAHAGMVERIRGKGTFALETGVGKMRDTRTSDHLIGFLLPDFSETYGVKLLYAVEERCHKYGAHLVVKRTFGSAEREAIAIQALTRLKVQCLIIFPVHGEHYNPEVLKLVLDGFPVVLVDRYLRGIPASAIFTDNRMAAASLTSHVLAEGYSRIAFVSPPAEHTSAIEDRQLGFQTTLARRRLVPAGFLTLYSSLPTSFTPPNIEADESRILTFLRENKGIDAFVASEYNLAVVLAHALVVAGKRVPEDVAIACFDAPHQPLQEPLFTHIQQDEALMGSLAVDLLIQQLGGERLSAEHALGFKLVEGRSTRRKSPYLNVTRDEIRALQASLGAPAS